MRYDKDFDFFSRHPEWYTCEIGVGYMPTKEAPPEAVEAIERYKKNKAERQKQGYVE